MAPVRRLFVLAALFASACGGSDLTLPGGVTPSELRIANGNDQDGMVGNPLDDPVVVEARDAQGAGLAGVRIAFSPAAGGSVNPATGVTDAGGRASASWSLGTTAGTQTLDARVEGSSGADLSVEFAASASAGSPQTLAQVSGQDQSAAVGTALPDSLVVEVTDEFGNPVSGIAVEWSASDGSVAPETIETGADGRAAARRILGSVAGPQSATAESPGLAGSPITFNHSALPGAAASLVLVSGDDQTGAPGAELAQPLVVRLVDGSGNGIPNRPVSWIVAPGSGTVSPTTSQTDQDGLTSTRWTLGPGEGTQNASAVASGIGVVQFSAGTGTGGGDGADHLIFRVQPSDQEEDRRLSPPVEVAVVDRNGNTVPLSNVRIRLSLSPMSNRLEGDREEDTESGVATFDDLRIDRDGEGFVLTATARDRPELGSVQSDPFDITDR